MLPRGESPLWLALAGDHACRQRQVVNAVSGEPTPTTEWAIEPFATGVDHSWLLTRAAGTWAPSGLTNQRLFPSCADRSIGVRPLDLHSSLS
jgi:hypothetical protein